MNHRNRYIHLEKENRRKIEEQTRSIKHLHLGVVIYFLVFAYLIFCIISFTFAKKTNYTIAELGSIIDSKTFTGLIIRDETLVTSDLSGTINYFVPEGEKVKKGSMVCLIDMQGQMTDLLQESINQTNKTLYENINYSENNYEYIQNQIRTYVLSKNRNTFQYTYNAKRGIEKAVVEMTNTMIIKDQEELKGLLSKSEMLQQQLGNNASIFETPKSGIVSYYLDGFEGISIENFKINDLNKEITDQQPLAQTVQMGDPIFKIVDNYKWYIAAEVDDATNEFLLDKNNVTIFFNKKDIEISAKKHRIIKENDQYFVILEIDRYINQFLSDRYIDFTIVFEKANGIKIPNTAIVSKEFVEIPSAAIHQSGNKYMVYKKVFSDEYVGGESIETITLNMIYSSQDMVYIPMTDSLKQGDILVYSLEEPDSEIQLAEITPIDGVYVINEGYVAFKLIETISFNEDYRIVKEKTPYGVRMHDRIVTDSKYAKENEFIE